MLHFRDKLRLGITCFVVCLLSFKLTSPLDITNWNKKFFIDRVFRNESSKLTNDTGFLYFFEQGRALKLRLSSYADAPAYDHCQCLVSLNIHVRASFEFTFDYLFLLK